MSNKIDDVMPSDKWEFDDTVADCFENMLERSIPQYDIMRDSCIQMIHGVLEMTPLKRDASILDIGCSDGLMIERMYKEFGDSCRYTGIEVSEAMIKKAKYRMLDEIVSGKVLIKKEDLRTWKSESYYDIVTSILTLQFTPIEYRQHILQTIYSSLSKCNGSLILVEKVLGNTDKLNNMMVDTYYKMKSDNGYTEEQIARKKLSLEGVLVPVTNDWNIDLLKQAGFRQVDVFWRWMNFVGYIAIK